MMNWTIDMIFRAGSWLKILGLLFLTTAVFAAEQGPQVIVRSAPDNPVAGSNWTLILLIAHDDPAKTEVLAPPFTGALLLDQVIKLPRLLNPATGQILAGSGDVPPAFERWTAMEYRFILGSAGTISFGAFTVITPQGRAQTAPFDLTVRPPRSLAGGQEPARQYRLVWEGIPPGLQMGESAVLSLRGSLLSETGLFVPAASLMPPVPPGHILVSIPLTAAEHLAGVVLKLRLIPLHASPFVLERRQVSHNNAGAAIIFEIPALRIPVSAAPPAQAAMPAARPETLPAEKPAPAVIRPPFPAGDTVQHKDVYHAAKKLWEDGQYARALAMLRRNEQGRGFAVLRREAEQALGFVETNDEKRKKLRSAVLLETAVRRIPDNAGAEIARFREGQPVLVRVPAAAQQPWLQVITNDTAAISGWVPKDAVLFVKE